MSAIVDETEGKAKKKYEEYLQYVSYDGSLVFMSGWTGIDFGSYAPNDTVRHVETNTGRASIHALTAVGAGSAWTIDQVAKWGGIGGLGPVIVGSPSQVADILQEWVEETDVDGFNLAYAVTPESFENVVEYLVPELQKRGAYPTAYKPGTLREKLFEDGPLLSVNHPAESYRRLHADQS